MTQRHQQNFLIFLISILLNAAIASNDLVVKCDSGCFSCLASGTSADCKPCPIIAGKPTPIGGLESLSIDGLGKSWVESCFCHENCETCEGPGEYECRTCKESEGYCMKEKRYRESFYGGLGSCWKRYCTTPNKDDESSSASSYYTTTTLLLLVVVSFPATLVTMMSP